MQLVINWSSRLQKTHKTLEILTKVDFFTHFLKYHIFRDFLNSLVIVSSWCKNCCMNFISPEQDRPNRTELDSSIL